MKQVTAAENCLPPETGAGRGSTARTRRLCEEVATRYFGPFTEIREANGSFAPSEGASPWKQACERFVHVRDRLTAYLRPDDLLAGAFVRGDGPAGPGWLPAGEDWYIDHFAGVSPEQPEWVRAMAARGLISPQGSFNHKIADYAGFLRTGSLATIERAKALLPGRSGIAREITEGFIAGHECMIRTAERYAAACESMAESAGAGPEKDGFLEMARICRKVPAHPAGTFHEAVQMLWFAYMVSADGTGRPDQYLYDYYKADMAAGRIDEARAQELIEAFMIKLHGEFFEGVFNVSSVQTMTLGGCDADGNDACNALTMLFLRAIRSVRLLRPTVYIRCTGNTPREILDFAVAMLGEGLGEPNFYGDKPVIEGLARAGVPVKDARDYALSGCAEVVSPGKGNWGAPNGWINMARLALEALHAAAEAQTQEIGGFWELYENLCEGVAEACAISNLHSDEACADFRYESTIMYPCCLEKGSDVVRGGLETYFGHWEGVGLPNAADMVYTAQKLAWEAGIPLSDIIGRTEGGQDAELRAAIGRLHKFGGDHAEVDDIAAKLVEILSRALESKAPGLRRGLFLGHLAGGENMHIAYGNRMPATIDGRGAGRPLADSMACGQGRAGPPTAVVRSLCRLDHSRLQAGNVSTLHLTPADFATERGRENVVSLIRTFVALGGSQLQFNVLDAAVLREAQANPGLYPNIIVRVAGYSSAFNGLGKPVQDEIISRYERAAQ